MNTTTKSISRCGVATKNVLPPLVAVAQLKKSKAIDDHFHLSILSIATILVVFFLRKVKCPVDKDMFCPFAHPKRHERCAILIYRISNWFRSVSD